MFLDLFDFDYRSIDKDLDLLNFDNFHWFLNEDLFDNLYRSVNNFLDFRITWNFPELIQEFQSSIFFDGKHAETQM